MDSPGTASLAIVFADIAGSTRLYEKCGNAVAQKIIEHCLAVLREIAGRQGGTVVKEIGDEIMCTFLSAEDAAVAAEEMQRAVQQASRFGKFENEQIRIRIGFHFGEVILEQADVFGGAVNVAARVVAQAKAQQILTTSDTLEQLKAQRRSNVRLIDRVMLKGKTGELELHELLWEVENLTVLQAGVKTDGAHITTRLSFQGTELVVDVQHPIVRLGRGEENELVVPDNLASRLHARLECRKGKVWLIDQSLNGTYLHIEGESEVHLRRDEYALHGRGVISLGRSTGTQPAFHILFTCN